MSDDAIGSQVETPEEETKVTTITVLCGANEAKAESGETIGAVAERLREELNIPPTYDAWISYDNEGGREDEVVKDHEAVLETKVYELEFVKPGHAKG